MTISGRNRSRGAAGKAATTLLRYCSRSLALAALTVLFCVLSSGSAGAGLSGSKHDFSLQPWSGGATCFACHGAHPKDPVVSVMWNHDLSTATYTLYSSPSLNASPGQPPMRSKLCLSCHDGTVALENFGGYTSGTNYISGTAKISTDLSDDHPIGFVFDSTLVTLDGALRDPGDSSGSSITPLRLYNGVLECATCHDVHNQGVAGTKMLRVDTASSELCLKCHIK